MQRRILLALVFAILLIAVSTQAQFKKYDIKSGVVTYELIMKVGSMELKKKTMVYFDDYGMKECRETYTDGKLDESYFSDGKFIYAVKPSKKIAIKQGDAYRGTELRVDWTEFGTEKDRQSGKIKKISPMNIAGKNCEAFETNDGKGTITRYAGWNKILMYLSLDSKSVKSSQKAVKVEENAKVSEDKFKIPAGYTVK